MAIERQTAFKGSITALVTPFQDGRFDEDRFRAFVDWQIVNGTHGLVPVGTTGESPTLSHEEHRKVIAACVSEAKGRVPVIAGAGSNNTQEAIELARFAEAAGADGLLIVTPYYNKPSQEGLFRHFKAVNDAVGIPIIIYNIPPRSVVDMSIDTMKRLYELKNIAGVKDATGNVARTALQRHALGPRFHPAFGRGHDGSRGDGAWRPWLHFGDLECRAETLRANAGGVSCRRFRRGSQGCRTDWPRCTRPCSSNPVRRVPNMRSQLLGKILGEIRLPMLPASETAQAAIKAAMIHAGLIHA